MRTVYRGLTRTERIIMESKRRRTAEVREQIVIIILAVALAIALSVLFFGRKVNAEGADHKDKCYVSVQVKETGSVTDLAKEYYSGEFKSVERMAAEIKHINNLGSDTLTSGLFIVIPVYR